MGNLPNLTGLDAEKCKRSLFHFVQSAWHIVEPVTPFVDGWHIRMECQYLEAVYAGQIKRLVINVPPRTMKSLLCNVFFPAWVWTKAPHMKFLHTSYSQDLTTEDSIKCRNLITSDWYTSRFDVRLVKGQQEKLDYANTTSGFRKSFGFGGAMTGQGGDFIIIDDPLKAIEAESEAARKNANQVMDSVIPTRLNDQKTGRIVLIMQRLHEDDPAGHVLGKDNNWEHLVLPMEYEGERFVSSLGLKDPRTEIGELLWPEKFDAASLRAMKTDMASDRIVAGQLQQRPSPLEGNIFKKEWFNQRYEGLEIVAWFISWDTAAGISEDNAYSACVVGGLTADYRLLICNSYEKKLEFPQLASDIRTMALPYKERLFEVIIEKKSSGIQAIQTLKQSTEGWLSDSIRTFMPKGDKAMRATIASKWCENGSVILPPPLPENGWLFTFEDRIFNFPNGKYKDMGDAFSQLVLFVEPYLSTGWKARNGAL